MNVTSLLLKYEYLMRFCELMLVGWYFFFIYFLYSLLFLTAEQRLA